MELLARRGGPIDQRRGEQRDRLDDHPTTTELVACLVEPYCRVLETEGGRSYVRIVAQLRGRFASWRLDSDASTTKSLARIIDEIESVSDVSVAERRQRTVGMMMLMTGLVSERARVVDEGLDVELAHADFVDLVTDMCATLVSTDRR